MNGTILSPIATSLQVAFTASILAFACALFISAVMKRKKFKGKVFLETAFLLPLVLPPSVVGFALLTMFGRTSPVGALYEHLSGHPLVFTRTAAVIAAAVVAFPLAYMSMRTGFAAIDRDLEDVAQTMGATRWQLFFYVTIPLAWRSLLTGYILAFARALGEFGATLMFAGNIPGRTQTIPTAVYIAVQTGNRTAAYVLVFVTISFSFLLLLATSRVKH